MQVTLKYEQREQGILNRRPLFVVHVMTKLSEIEATAIQHVGLRDTVVMDNIHKGEKRICTCGSLVTGGQTFSFDDFVDAVNFMQTAKRKLQSLKSILEAAVAVSGGHEETFEI